ncbi:MAG: D-alanyl-D-alanine carboxypeptidase [Clostridia bacterium]|nr:D-alanyl-D-alanine carboxypeptidase [Clostridia bacterium]
MKRSIKAIFFVCCLIALLPLCHQHAYAEEGYPCKSAILMEYETATVLNEYRSGERLPIASMCKIMTVLLALEHIDSGAVSLSDTVHISENAQGMGGSQVFLEANASYPLSELIKSAVVASANDACVAIAELVCGSEEAFVSKMNARAKELGMENTVYTNCTGLPKPGQYSTAYDVALCLRQLLSHPVYYEYSRIWMDTVSHPKGRVTEISNTNKLIRSFSGCDGGKTGYTSEAGHCVAATAKRNEMRLISVVIGASDGKTRFKTAASLFEEGFASYGSTCLVDSSKRLEVVLKTQFGKQKELPLVFAKSYSVFAKKGEKTDCKVEYELPEKVKAPVNKGDRIGRALIYKEGVVVEEIEILADECIDPMDFGDIFALVIENWNL